MLELVPHDLCGDQVQLRIAQGDQIRHPFIRQPALQLQQRVDLPHVHLLGVRRPVTVSRGEHVDLLKQRQQRGSPPLRAVLDPHAGGVGEDDRHPEAHRMLQQFRRALCDRGQLRRCALVRPPMPTSEPRRWSRALHDEPRRAEQRVVPIEDGQCVRRALRGALRLALGRLSLGASERVLEGQRRRVLRRRVLGNNLAARAAADAGAAAHHLGAALVAVLVRHHASR
mmetsp:Transcript_81677/g.229100  ORF Transcript_81677/g.229100 Transcript_81677/m.229100 type:complete len:227 (-) Transcript_81677:59-739(-)